ncbi:MAG: 2-oxoacid:acceptor oxidoreductase family protein [Actinomycetota bacterium]|nr:2-oxoacid:acceptor oxidoreductase family protein [Actinomycetota bacterium]
MERLVEIRWHGRGGQGAVTAAKFLAEAALAEGKYVQAFPEYGPERMGAPIQAFTRLSSDPIRTYCGIENPKVVVVLDPTLLNVIDVAQGLVEDGVLIVNTPEPPSRIKERLGLEKAKVYTVDASTIAHEELGRPIPNTPMIGALIKATEVLGLGSVTEHFQEVFADKFSPKVIEGNVKAIRRAFKEVKSG